MGTSSREESIMRYVMAQKRVRLNNCNGKNVNKGRGVMSGVRQWNVNKGGGGGSMN